MNWIGGAVSPPGQSPIKLSRNIESFEVEFSNVYLFGEIFGHYNLIEISNFSKKLVNQQFLLREKSNSYSMLLIIFSFHPDRTNKESKVTNFFQVEEVLR